MDKIRIGTRGSRLALKQAELVREAIGRVDPQADTELVILHTKGDRILDKPLAEIGDKGLFVSEFEQALLEGRIDLAVHSAKDLPMRLAQGLTIAAVLPRADVRDVLVVKKGGRLPEKFTDRFGACGAEGPTVKAFRENAEPDRLSTYADENPGVRIETAAEQKGQREHEPFRLGTGSKRRQVQAQRLWENVSCSLIRGNVETRLKKLEEGSFDGILLAKAGLDRLGIGQETDERFDFYALCPEQFLPAACQGIIAVEAKEDCACRALLSRISDEETYLAFCVEQEVLACLEADCSEAAAAWCRRQEDGLVLDVMYGTNRAFLAGEAAQGPELARRAARRVKGR